jgi:gallate decarboxylase subunit D
MTTKPNIWLRCGKNSTFITLKLYRVGKDFLGVLTGGEAHVGACALGSLLQSGKISVRTLTVTHHYETEIVRALAGEICRVFHCSCVLVGGIHFENIKRPRILEILRLASVLREKIRKLHPAMKKNRVVRDE